MADWATFLDGFLELNSYSVLPDKGKVSALTAKLKAEAEFESFRKVQDAAFESDFDRFVEQAKRLTKNAADEADPHPKDEDDG